MNRLGVSIILVFSAALLLYLTTWLDTEKPIALPSQEEALVPNYEARNMRTKLFDKNGMLTHEVAALSMEHYELLGFVTFEAPVYTIYLEGHAKPWKITAKEGTLYDNNRIQLEDSVLITNQQTDDYITQIETDFIEINLSTKILESDQAVTISGADYIINSIGFSANLETQLYDLSQHVQTQYYPTR